MFLLHNKCHGVLYGEQERTVVQLNFLNRTQEIAKLKRVLRSETAAFACVYGRRRCGKSRLLRETLPLEKAVYYVADEREPALQREALAAEMARLLPGFDDVSYPDWDALLRRWWNDAPAGTGLAVDELPYLVKRSPELPSLLQKHYDVNQGKPLPLILCGSSQTMMYGLVLDADAPLYGRATEILKIQPLKAGWITDALPILNGPEALLAYTLWGGIPRYWELAADYDNSWDAYQHLVLDPMGVLHGEPERLLHEDMRDTAQSMSILSLIGQGCHRISELAGRLGKPATSLSRPLKKLMDLGLICKEIPFGADPKSNKHSLYRIQDPFLAAWYRHVLPNRSLLERGVVDQVRAQMAVRIQDCQAFCWEQLSREAVPFLRLGDTDWLPASRWWGTSTERNRMEVDIVAESFDRQTLLVGEAKLNVTAAEVERLLFELERKAKLLPFADHYRRVEPFLFVANLAGGNIPDRLVTSHGLFPQLQ